MRLIKEKTNIDFLSKKRRTAALVLSVLFVVISIASLATRGLNLGIDFTGGVLLEVQYPQAADLENIRQILQDAGYDEVLVNTFGPVTDVAIRLPPQPGADANAIRDSMTNILAANDPEIDLRSVEFVSSQVGDELTEQGGLAMIFALLMIFAYVMFRFQWKFAAGAVAALAHDVIVTVGFFSVFQFSFDLTVVAAVLAVIGYSLNDTVVAFDRIRENFTKLRGTSAEDAMNISINEMLARHNYHRCDHFAGFDGTAGVGRRSCRAIFNRPDRRHRNRNVFFDLHGKRNRTVAACIRAGLNAAGDRSGN